MIENWGLNAVNWKYCRHLLLILSKSLGHLSSFRTSGVRACDGTTKCRPSTTPLLTNHRTADHSNVDVIGWKKCRWSKFRHTGVRSYVGNTKGTQTILDWKVSLWQNTSWPSPECHQEIQSIHKKFRSEICSFQNFERRCLANRNLEQIFN